jgi:alpha,alpha-trehalose phosphorylase
MVPDVPARVLPHAAAMTHFPFDAVLFDLDGVLTSTAAVHAACWKEAFEERLGEPFDVERDYLAHVDGKPREDGVRDFMRARGLQADPDVVHAVGAFKQALVERALATGGVEAYPGSVKWVRWLRDAGVRTAVVSSSANCGAVLRAAGIEDLFELTVDGGDVARLGLRGKPAPDGFLEAAGRMGVRPRTTVVVEDALAGVAAGRRGGFGLVVGVARGASAPELLRAGADIVVDDLAEMIR